MASYTANVIGRAIVVGLMTREAKVPYEYVKDLITSFFSLFPVFGRALDSIVRSTLNAAFGQPAEWRGEAMESLLVNNINKVSKGTANFGAAVGYLLSGDVEKAEKSFTKGADYLADSIGMMFGIPVPQAKKFVKSFDEDEEPTEGGGIRRVRRASPSRRRSPR